MIRAPEQRIRGSRIIFSKASEEHGKLEVLRSLRRWSRILNGGGGEWIGGVEGNRGGGEGARIYRVWEGKAGGGGRTP